jgi:acyl-CoA synthetase (AMP-forming)/AMP-acid ligase II
MSAVDDPLPPFRAVPDLIREHAAVHPRHAALVQGDEVIRYGELDALMDHVAASLQRDGIKPGDSIAICAHSSPRYAAVFLGALRAGVAVAPLAPSVTAEQFASMLHDAQAKLLFIDGAAESLLRDSGVSTACITLDNR